MRKANPGNLHLLISACGRSDGKEDEPAEDYFIEALG